MTELADRESFIKWAVDAHFPLSTVLPDSSREDLAPLGRMLGNASVISLSEGVHCGAEPLEFRNRVLQYLVQEKGFTAIAIESGLVESRIVHEYVRGGAGDLSAVLFQGISWCFDQLPQNRALLQWLREHNANPRHTRKVNFYGFDVSGSPANGKANRGIDTALTETLRYLSRVDSAACAAFHARLDALMQNLRFALRRSENDPGYERLNQAERDALTAGIADLIALIERREGRYTQISGANDYAWAHQAAIDARQVDAWLRQIPPGWQPVRESAELSGEQVGPLMTAADVRDRAQADNLDWIIQREGASGKILVFAHRYHLSTARVRSRFWGANEEREQEVAGTYLRRRLGERLLTIGNLIGQGELECGDFRQTLKRAPIESFDGLAGEVGTPLYLLDLRTAATSIKNWLNREHCLDSPPHVCKLAIGRAFDVLFYIDTVTPACGKGAHEQR